MPLSPHPPPALARKKLPIIRFNGPLFRIHRTEDNPLHFGRRMLHRFDSPDGKYGVLYAGEDLFCAFIETLGHEPGRDLVEMRDLEIRSVATLEGKRGLRLVDFCGSGLAKVGADARLCVGDYHLAQQWSQALHDDTERPDGIRYPSRRDPSRISVALFHRCRSAIRVTNSIELAWHPDLSTVLGHYGFGLA